MATTTTAAMSEPRALLTDREREIISGTADVSDDYRYQTISRVRRRFGRLKDDLRVLEHHDTLADELRDTICEDQDTNETTRGATTFTFDDSGGDE